MAVTIKRVLTIAAPTASLLFLCGCASAPTPTRELAAADLAVEQAEASMAPSLAPAVLERARDKRSRAEAAAEAGANENARRLAEEAAVDARLAEATADAEVAKQSHAEMRTTIDTLRQTSVDPALTN